jgi:predicted nuclease of predicted toxin-antitoxin system
LRLLFDQNLSNSLVRQLSDLFPDHVREAGLSTSEDETVWEYARAGSFIIVSKDSDFHEMSIVRGHPPKVIWIRRGNCSTQAIASLLRSSFTAIEQFSSDTGSSVLMLL